jgi:hypothetical protein
VGLRNIHLQRKGENNHHGEDSFQKKIFKDNIHSYLIIKKIALLLPMACPQMKPIDLSWNHDPNFECFISLNNFIYYNIS